MHIGALIDIGLPEELLQSELSKLPINGEFELAVEKTTTKGIAGTKATVHSRTDDKTHRNLESIRRLINDSGLGEAVQSSAIDIFTQLAEAEAAVHNKGINEIHFHEVGAVDAIVDITAAAIGLDYFKPDAVIGSTVELGSGTVKCAHGVLPVPAPATAYLLKGVPTKRGGIVGEATTPTGAAIIKSCITSWDVNQRFVAEEIGYGVGQKEFSIPNAMRLSLGSTERPVTIEENIEIECNIDDMSPEAYAPLMDHLLSQGAKDVFLSPITMKKSRLATKLTVLVTQEREPAIVQAIMRHSSTLGVRTHPVSKIMLSRKQEEFSTSLGQVRVKISHLPDGGFRWKSEYDDVAKIAQQSKVSFLDAKAKIDAEIAKQMDAR